MDWRATTLHEFFRVDDPVEWEVFLWEMRRGRVRVIPSRFRVPYGVLWERARRDGRTLGVRDDGGGGYPAYHPILYLWSAIYLVGSEGCWLPEFVDTVYGELHG